MRSISFRAIEAFHHLPLSHLLVQCIRRGDDRDIREVIMKGVKVGDSVFGEGGVKDDSKKEGVIAGWWDMV